MERLKLAKYGINSTSISSASQFAEISNAINAEEVKALREKQAILQLEEQRHKENIELQQKSLNLAEKSMTLAEDANKKSSISNWIAIISMAIAFASAIISLISLLK